MKNNIFQLGRSAVIDLTCGGGNHFVEWVRLDVLEDNPLGIPLGD